MTFDLTSILRVNKSTQQSVHSAENRSFSGLHETASDPGAFRIGFTAQAVLLLLALSLLLIASLLTPTVHAQSSSESLTIGVAGIWHESNSFTEQSTTLEHFGVDLEATAEERLDRLYSHESASNREAGYIAESREQGVSLYAGLMAGATPMGPVTDHAFETMLDRLIETLQEGPELDGIILHLHGAMVVESYPSGDEEIVRRVRDAFGEEMPIVVTHDFHANITEETVALSDVLITFKENPHVDTYDRGVQAVNVLSRMIRGEVDPVQRIVKPPMVYNIVFQSTFNEPLLPIVDESKELEENPNVLAASVSGGYQYADVPGMGPSVVIVTDGDPGLAQNEAERLGEMLWETRHETVLNEPQPEEAVREAMAHEGRPVLLIDMGDNIGGGSAGDSTFLLEELLRQNAEGFVMVIYDPEAYAVAEEAGVGESFDFQVGGKTDQTHGDPVRIQGSVRSLHEGRYVEPEVRHGGGRYWNMGNTAVIHLEGSSLDEPNLVLLTTERSSPNSAHQLISNGVYVERQKIIVAKGAIAPRAAYEPIVSLMIPVDSPGATAVNPEWFEYEDVRDGLFGMPE
ncbi:MAG: M81 family metallopeptidase [Bacteroidota bacterium]